MHKIDFERAALLMDIQSKVANISPLNAAIAGEASEELKVIKTMAEENAAERQEQQQREYAERQAEEARKREEADRNRNAVEPARGHRQPQPLLPGEPTPAWAEDPPKDDLNKDGLADEQEGNVGQTPGEDLPEDERSPTRPMGARHEPARAYDPPKARPALPIQPSEDVTLTDRRL